MKFSRKILKREQELSLMKKEKKMVQLKIAN